MRPVLVPGADRGPVISTPTDTARGNADPAHPPLAARAGDGLPEAAPSKPSAPAGSTGLTEPVGSTGLTEPAGASAPAGSTGLTAPVGSTGLTAPAGSTGLTEPVGSTGLTEPASAAPAGSTGLTAPAGAAAPANGDKPHSESHTHRKPPKPGTLAFPLGSGRGQFAMGLAVAGVCAVAAIADVYVALQLLVGALVVMALLRAFVPARGIPALINRGKAFDVSSFVVAAIMIETVLVTGPRL
ncbi:hypothetical protein FB389_1856 [Rarobacter incanus]|uniref:DUF3017 family protein n=2 Tax=Rarobacter incanus TaxID=153494 RepID=A0A542SRA6_9MICO|nr:hypothetical protein FB389_1856 [Rarobacter incanus]